MHTYIMCFQIGPIEKKNLTRGAGKGKLTDLFQRIILHYQISRSPIGMIFFINRWGVLRSLVPYNIEKYKNRTK